MSENVSQANDEDVKIIMMFDRCRTGSTTVLRSLAAIPGVASYQEVMSGIYDYSYQKFLLDAMDASEQNKARFRSEGALFLFEDYIEWLKATAKSTYGDIKYLVVECKIENMSVFSAQWHNPMTGFWGNEFLRRAMKISDGVIFLRRMNVVARLSSHLAASQTGIFHSKDGDQTKALETREIKKLQTPADKLINVVAQENEFDQAFADFLKQNAPGATLLKYEEVFSGENGGFSDGFRSEMAAIFGGAAPEMPIMKKVRSLSEREIIENYDDLVAVMRKDAKLSNILQYMEI